MEEKSEVAPAPVTHLPDLSPDLVHKNLMRCFVVGNRVDRKLLDWLRVYVELTYSVDLGLSGAVPYVMKNLKCRHSEAYARIGRPTVPVRSDGDGTRPPPLPPHRRCLREGPGVFVPGEGHHAAQEREEGSRWLEFSHSHTVEELCEAVEDAVSNDRDSPRPKGAGLLNRRVDLKMHVTRSDREIIRKALEKKAAALVASGKVKPKDLTRELVLTTMAIRVPRS